MTAISKGSRPKQVVIQEGEHVWTIRFTSDKSDVLDAQCALVDLAIDYDKGDPEIPGAPWTKVLVAIHGMKTTDLVVVVDE